MFLIIYFFFWSYCVEGYWNLRVGIRIGYMVSLFSVFYEVCYLVFFFLVFGNGNGIVDEFWICFNIKYYFIACFVVGLIFYLGYCRSKVFFFIFSKMNLCIIIYVLVIEKFMFVKNSLIILKVVIICVLF